MGLFDTVRCRATVPGTELLRDGELQTYDMGRRMESFTITSDGRLIHHRMRYELAARVATPPGEIPQLYQRIPDGDVEVPLHRDISLSGESATGQHGWFVARFTDGRLEWIRPRESLSEDHREYLTAGV